ncbi:MAG: LytTR family DNA-binding domain-containing protein [Salibacteraceae bacterium]
MTALILDDEFMAGEYLSDLITTHCPEIKKVLCEQFAKDAIEKLNQENIDLLFLDIEMPDMTGFELIEIIGLEKLPPVIFTSAFGEYALRAIKVSALDYLLKPIDPVELLSAIEKAKHRSPEGKSVQLSNLLTMTNEGENHRLVIADGSDYFLVEPDEIVRIEGNGSYSTFVLEDNRKITSSRPLNFYYKKLLNKGFLRSHQSHVINLKWIDVYSKADGGFLRLKNKESLPVSSRLKKNVQKILGLG